MALVFISLIYGRTYGLSQMIICGQRNLDTKSWSKRFWHFSMLRGILLKGRFMDFTASGLSNF